MTVRTEEFALLEFSLYCTQRTTLRDQCRNRANFLIDVVEVKTDRVGLPTVSTSVAIPFVRYNPCTPSLTESGLVRSLYFGLDVGRRG